MNISHLNIRGWTKENCTLRKNILLSLHSDIICLSETHLDGNESCELPGYHWIGFNRPVKHVKSPYNFGGVGIFVKNYLYEYFKVCVEDKVLDGILEISLRHKNSNLSIVVFCCYLPPERSPWGRNISDYFAHIMSQLYLCAEDDIVILCGDMNARIGEMKDYTVNLDNVQDRKVIDLSVNNHGKTFIEFLIDGKLCVLNGRFDTESDNYTFVSPMGKSVVDYMFVPQDVLTYCSNFKVHTISQIMDNLKLETMLTD